MIDKTKIVNIIIYTIIVILLIIIIVILGVTYNLINVRKKNNIEKFVMPNPKEAKYINYLSKRNLNLAKNAVNFNPNIDYTKPGDYIIVDGDICKEIDVAGKNNKVIYSNKDDDIYSDPSTSYNTEAEINIGIVDKELEPAIQKYNLDSLLLPDPEMKYIYRNYYNYYETPKADILLGTLYPQPYKPIKLILYGIRSSTNFSDIKGIIVKNNDKTKLIDHIEFINNKFTYIPKKVEESGNWTRYSLGDYIGDNIYSVRFVDSLGNDVFKCNDNLIWAIY